MDTRDWLRCFEANAGEVLRPAPEAYTLTAAAWRSKARFPRTEGRASP